MVRWLFLFLFTLCQFKALPQGSLDGKTEVVDPTVNPGQILDEFPMPKPGISGTAYYDEEWRPGKIYMGKGRIIDNYSLRINLYHNDLEIKVENSVRVCPYELIEKFILYSLDEADSAIFTKAESYFYPSKTSLTGFFEILSSDRFSVARLHGIEIKKPDYVTALDVGSRDTKLVKTSKQFFVSNDTIRCEFEKNIRRMESCLPGNIEEHEEFIKLQKLKLKRKEDLVKFLEYLNSQ